MDEPLIARPTLGQRLDLLAVAKPKTVRRATWFFGVLALLSAVRVAAAFASELWGIGALVLLTALGAAAIAIVSRRALLRIPATQRWIDELSDGLPPGA